MLKKRLTFFTLFICFFSFSQINKFYHFGNRNGLSQESVQVLLKASDGFLWLGTQDGLNRFDGKRFTVYKHIRGQKNSISGNFITQLVENEGEIWIGTSNNGVSIYNNVLDSFKSVGLQNGNCTALANDKNKIVYAGYLNEGLFAFNTEKDSVKTLEIPFFKDNNLKITKVSCHGNRLYVGTKSGRVFHSNIKNYEFQEMLFPKGIGTIKSFLFNEDNSIFIGSSNGLYLWEDNETHSVFIPQYKHISINKIIKSDDTYYFATDDGLHICSGFDFIKYQFSDCNIYKGDKNSLNSITSNRVYDILLDGDLLWAGTNKLDLLILENPVFNSITTKTKPFIGNPHVYSILKTDSFLFIGTRNGLTCIAPNGKTTVINKQNTNKLASNVIRSIAVFQDKLWLGTTKGVSIIDLHNFDPKQPKIQSFYAVLNNPNTLSNNNIRNIFMDSDNKLWISTYGGGINLFTGNVKQHKFTFKQFHQQNGKSSLSSDYVFNITQDKEGVYWIATKFGLTKMEYSSDKENPVFTVFKNQEEGKNTLNTSNILTTFHDSDNQLWIGTQNGLYHLDTKKMKFTSFGTKEGLTNNVIYNILEDKHNNLWLSTNSGLFKFNKKYLVFTNYTVKDGLLSSEYNLGAQFKDPKTGELYFGGTNGVDYFQPMEVVNLYQEGDLKFTSLSVKDEILKPDENHNIITRNITKSNQINLSHQDFPIYLTFSDLNFKPYKNSTFYYKLVPNDTKWNPIKKGNEIQLLNLSAGDYKLLVQGKSHQKFWDKKPLEIKIAVSPPLYTSSFAYFFYFLLLSGLLFYIFKHYINQKLEHQEMLRLKELNELKTTLYTNITHEFRTPITVILGMAQTLKEKIKKEKINTNNELDLIEKNSNSLLKLVNQILDLSKLEKGKLKLHLEQSNIVNHIKYLTESFSSYAQEKGVSLTFYSEEDEVFMDYDSDKINQIISNLISNAIKFCNASDKIIIHLSKINSDLILKIQDTGIGIKEENLPYIFDRFYQVENSNTKKYDGTGIGLALAKELVSLMNGSITVKSKINKGTTFVIKLPITQNEPLKMDVQPEIPFVPNEISQIVTDTESQNKNLPIALVVEDNKDVAQYIITCLKGLYQVAYAKDGEEGVEKAIEIIPDIIISDVMMPKKDGLELCEIVKKDIKTNHIPIIILTAKSEQQVKISGLKLGADAFLTKPFDKEELLIRMQKLIAVRKTLQLKYQNIEQLVEETVSEKIEDQFLKQVIELIHDNIEDANFSANEIAEELFMSTSQFYRKIKALTNESPAVFIRKIRLQKAKELLETQNLSVSQVCYATGFNQPSWFSKVFKKEFGISPKEVKE